MAEDKVQIFEGDDARTQCIRASLTDKRRVFSCNGVWGLSTTRHRFVNALPLEVKEYKRSELQAIIAEEFDRLCSKSES